MPHWRSPRWLPSRQPPEQHEHEHGYEHEVHTEFLSECVGDTSIHRHLRYLDDRGEDVVPEPDQARPQHLVDNSEFHDWLTSQGSGRLLVHGCYGQASQISGLSLFCNSLMRVLARDKPSCVPLVFFCGMHNYPHEPPPRYDDAQQSIDADNAPPRYDDDAQPPAYTNIQLPNTRDHPLVRSLIYQLLRRLGDERISMKTRDLMGIQAGDLRALSELFSRLVRMLPHDVAVWCLVDGAEFYEQGEFWDDARLVLNRLVQLSNHMSTQASVRLLITTPTSTSRISRWFPGPQTVSLEATGWEEMEPDSTTLQYKLYNAVEQAHVYSRSTRLSYTGMGCWW